MKVIFITYHYLNGNGGGVFASRAYINALAEIADEITLLYPMKEGAEAEGLHPKVRKIAVWDRRGRLQKGFSLLAGRFNRMQKEHIGDAVYDLAVFDTSMATQGLLDFFRKRGTKVVTIHHNYQYEYYRDNSSGLLRIPWLFWSKRCEAEAFRGSDRNLTLTEADKQLLISHYGTGREAVDVLGVFEYERKEHPVGPNVTAPRFAITGNLSSKQTEDTLLPWMDDYYPVLKEIFPEAELTFAGKNPSGVLLRKAGEKGITVVPNPKSMDPILADAKYYICPTSLGGGLKLRVMDGLSAGLPVVCHEVSARGYEAFIELGILLPYSDTASFRSQLQKLLTLEADKEKIITQYERQFSFEAGKQRLLTILNSLR